MAERVKRAHRERGLILQIFLLRRKLDRRLTAASGSFEFFGFLRALARLEGTKHI